VHRCRLLLAHKMSCYSVLEKVVRVDLHVRQQTFAFGPIDHPLRRCKVIHRYWPKGMKEQLRCMAGVSLIRLWQSVCRSRCSGCLRLTLFPHLTLVGLAAVARIANVAGARKGCEFIRNLHSDLAWPACLPFACALPLVVSC
jgi:hypothetical protein